MIEIYVDGSGKDYISGIVGKRVFYEKVESLSNIHSEYLAIERALQMLEKGSSAVIYSDSKVVVNQLNHKYAINKEHLREVAIRIWNYINENDLNIEFRWIPRKMNKAGKILGS